MGLAVVVWSLKLLGTALNVLGSFKALKTRSKRVSGAQRITAQATGSKSLSAADRARRKAIRSELVTWTSWIALLQLERPADRIGALVPLYDELKLVLLLGLIILRQPVSQLIFDNLISPVLSPYETPLEAMGYAVGQLLALVLFLLLWPVTRVMGWWRPLQEEDVPSILAGLRVPNRPSLARDLANTIESSASRKPRPPPPSAPIPANQPRKAPAKLVASLAGSSSSVRLSSDSALARSTKALTTSRLPAPSSSRPSSKASASTSTASERTALYPDLTALPRVGQAPVAHSHALAVSTQRAARQEAQTASLLAALPSAPNGALTCREKQSSPTHERVTLPIPPPAAPAPTGAPEPQPSARSSPQPKPPPQQILDTPIPPGSFFGARSSAQQPFRPTPPRSKMLVSSPAAPAPAPPPAKVRAQDLARSASATSSAGTSGAATPRQKALSAIADLSPDLDGLGGSLLGVKRSSHAASPIVVARRTRKSTHEDSDYEEMTPKKKAPAKKTAPFRPTTKVGTATATGATKRKAAASTAGDTDSVADESDATSAKSLRASRSTRTIKPPTSEPSSTLSRSRSRAQKLAVPPVDRSGDSSDAVSLPVPRRKKKVGEEMAKEVEGPVAPVRKARRVLVKSKGVGLSEDEIDGVPVVVAARRSARK